MRSVRKLLPNPTPWFPRQQFFNAKGSAHRRLPGLIGFRRLFSEWPALARPTAYK
ncbi:hypothetical protein L873DRAFT_1810287 [Choiromyces venosus 120613-1]|uniref:Uncharacterized protein n=1 Tax=Choiromyces venosus 120613-1 TaxID=1336337 RepID=A0A3N4JFY8_9PEZI|nr:hypothetical protein L873DRAFT_1810287 [Choiromyces venosus 120613-1]